MTLNAHSYPVVNPVPLLSPEQLAMVEAKKVATKSDVTEIVNLVHTLVIEDAKSNKEEVI